MEYIFLPSIYLMPEWSINKTRRLIPSGAFSFFPNTDL